MQRYHVGHVLVEGVVLPALVHLLLGAGVQVLVQHHRLAHLSGTVGVVGGQQHRLVVLGEGVFSNKKERKK